MKKLIIVQTVAPDYRAVFFKTIKDGLGDEFELYCGDYYFQKNIRSSSEIECKKISNLFIFGRKLLIQSGLRTLYAFNGILVLEMNPRILTNWMLLTFRKITGRQTILWGHAWPRVGQGSKSVWLRNLMRTLAAKIIVYTQSQKKELEESGLKIPILAAPNALLSSKKMVTNGEEQQITNILYVGRLVTDKKPFLLLKSFHSVIDALPKTANLIFIGEGDERQKMEAYIKNHQLSNRVFLKGHISDYKQLKQLYFDSLLSVSPGYIGLSAIQSFGFGVPMLVSKNENHSPEIEAVNADNSMFFETDQIDSCAKQLLAFYKDIKFWIAKRQMISDECKNKYSAENMAKTFLTLVE